MPTRAKARQQRIQERIAAYLRQLEADRKPLASVADIARHLQISESSARLRLEAMERAGQVKIGRNQRNRILAGTIRLAEWEPAE